MTTRQELLTQWQQRLAEAEQACLAAESPAWSDRLRVKLYAFLLAMYGQTSWPGSKDDVDNERGRESAPLVVVEPVAEFTGKEPRTRAEILKGLRNVKGLGEELAPAGPLTAGLKPNSPMLVGTYKKLVQAEIAFSRLKRAGLLPTLQRQPGRYAIHVAVADSAYAMQLLREIPAPRQVRVTAPAATSDRSVSLLCALLFVFVSLICFCILIHVTIARAANLPKQVIPANWELAGFLGSAVVCLLVAVMLFRSWALSLRGPVLRFDFLSVVTVLTSCSGAALTSFLIAATLMSAYFPDLKLALSSFSFVQLAIGAVLFDLVALRLYWELMRLGPPPPSGKFVKPQPAPSAKDPR
ncbi:hypothetical protein [Anatilimnocola floriformis]|uniref:hypothetical protein n=1 Tax=Anatilimnocola floriformis TaxID=2948575 RepID=UPI0020C24FA6|nr:hypothetical protein [Anatilimnocola floriformis]